MDARLSELLPWYANGTLAEADRRWVDQQLHDDPEARAELAWYQNLQTRLQDDAPQVPDDIGLERTLRRIRTEVAPAAVPAAAPRTAPRSWLATLAEEVQSLLRSFQMTPALALAVLVITVQGGALLKMSLPHTDGEDAAEVRAVSGPTPSASGQLLRVNFKPQSTEAEIRLLLVSVQGNIEGGPGQLGDYFVRAPTARWAEAGSQFKASPLIDSLTPVDALPQRGQ